MVPHAHVEAEDHLVADLGHAEKAAVVPRHRRRDADPARLRPGEPGISDLDASELLGILHLGHLADHDACAALAGYHVAAPIDSPVSGSSRRAVNFVW